MKKPPGPIIRAKLYAPPLVRDLVDCGRPAGVIGGVRLAQVAPFWTLLLILVAAPSVAQEMSPRAYWPAPIGTKLLLAGYSYSSGDVVTDASLPISGVDSSVHSAVLGYQQTLDLLGRTSNLKIELPFIDGTTSGAFMGQPAQAEVSGIGDIALTLSINLLGAPAMDREQFRELIRDPHAIVGASIRVVAPTGEYDGDKLINIGTNRWATRIQLGYIQPLRGPWLLELLAGAWMFSDNDNFLGAVREQRPIGAVEAHVIHVTRSGVWASFDANYYVGGRSYLDGERRPDLQRNSRMGVTLSWPFKNRHLIKASFSRGVVTESGGDYTIASIAYAVRVD